MVSYFIPAMELSFGTGWTLTPLNQVTRTRDSDCIDAQVLFAPSLTSKDQARAIYIYGVHIPRLRRYRKRKFVLVSLQYHA
jgi:hypothetical protein